MGFWIFMFCMELLIPVTMILFGWIFMHRPPKEINSIYGYRTARSTASKEAWDFAHRYFGRLWFWGGIILVCLSVTAMLPLLGKDTNMVGNIGGILCMILCVLMILPIIPTEHMLKKKFQ